MKKILLLILVISMTNCKNDNNNIADANYQVEKDIKKLKEVRGRLYLEIYERNLHIY